MARPHLLIDQVLVVPFDPKPDFLAFDIGTSLENIGFSLKQGET